MLDRIEDALKDIATGKMVIVVDDEDRENEGDLVQAAELATTESVNFMAKYGRGMICVSLLDDHADRLELYPMVARNTALLGTNFTITIDYIHGTTTGISAIDRAKTIQAVTDSKIKSSDFAKPGHIHPIRAKKGGVLERAGQTEASMDLAKLAGLFPVGVLCEIMNDDGTMMRRPDLQKFAKLHNLKIISVEDLIEYRFRTEKILEERVRVDFPTKHGNFQLIHFADPYQNKDHLAIVKGPIPPKAPVLVRAHSECLTGDVFGSARCDCGWQLDNALAMMEEAGAGVLVYLRQEGRGIGLGAKLQAYKLQDSGLDTVEANLKLGFKADQRSYGACAQILRQLGVSEIKLITNNPKKVEGLSSHGIKVVERVPLLALATEDNKHYLLTKRDKMGHFIPIEES